MDSLDPQTYARLHRGADVRNIERIIEGVDALLALGKSPDQMINCITFTALQSAEDAMATMRWWMREKGIRTCLTMFNPAGMGAEVMWERRTTKGFGTTVRFSRTGDLFAPAMGFVMMDDYTAFYTRTLYGWFPGKDSALSNHDAFLEARFYLDNGTKELLIAEVGPGWDGRPRADWAAWSVPSSISTISSNRSRSRTASPCRSGITNTPM